MPRSALVRAARGAARGTSVARRTVRIDKDFYETPVLCATEICARLCDDFPDLSPMHVLEPSCGGGNFIQAIRTVWPDTHIVGVDILFPNVIKASRAIVDVRRTSIIESDILHPRMDGYIYDADLVAGNPPFSHAEKHVLHLLSRMHFGAMLALLLPVSFITTQGRAKRLYNNAPFDFRTGFPTDARGPYGELAAVMPLAERPGFTLNGKSDMSEYAVYIWFKGKNPSNPFLLPHLWWHERKGGT